MKTKEELTQIKQEYETLTAKLNELTDDELKLVTGGASDGVIQFEFSESQFAFNSSSSDGGHQQRKP